MKTTLQLNEIECFAEAIRRELIDKIGTKVVVFHTFGYSIGILRYAGWTDTQEEMDSFKVDCHPHCLDFNIYHVEDIDTKNCLDVTAKIMIKN